MYSNAIGFTYNNKSLSDFEHKLVIGHINKSDDSFGLDREVITGTTTTNREIYHAYNTKYSSRLTFSVTVLHADQSRFSMEEISELTRWITSPRSYRKLQFFDCNEELYDIVYYALCTKISPESSGGIVGLTLEFECNASYGFKERQTNVIDTLDELVTPNHNIQITLQCDSDELESYICPTIILDSPELWSNVKIINHSDNDSVMDLYDTKGEYEINCQHQVIMQDGKNLFLSSLFKMDTLKRLYWLRLVPGENQLEITGRCQTTIKWLEPKKVGSY